MSVPITEPTHPEAAPTAPTPAPAKPEPPAYTAPATQADLDRIIADRLSREKAKYADYEDIKAKASEYDKVQEASKTELQKLQDRLAASEKAAAEATAKALRADVAAAKGVPASLLSGDTKEALEASADALIAFRGQTPPPLPAAAPSANGQGKVGEPVGASVAQLTADDLARMTAAKDYDGITKAQAEGRFNTLLGVN